MQEIQDVRNKYAENYEDALLIINAALKMGYVETAKEIKRNPHFGMCIMIFFMFPGNKELKARYKEEIQKPIIAVKYMREDNNILEEIKALEHQESNGQSDYCRFGSVEVDGFTYHKIGKKYHKDRNTKPSYGLQIHVCQEKHPKSYEYIRKFYVD